MMTTEQLAEKLHVQPGSIRASLCRKGHWCGIRPIKLPNRFLAWPDDTIDQIMTNTEKEQQRGAK